MGTNTGFVLYFSDKNFGTEINRKSDALLEFCTLYSNLVSCLSTKYYYDSWVAQNLFKLNFFLI